MARFGQELEAFAAARLAGKKKRSIALPAGVVGFRKQPARMAVEDEAAALAWAKAHGVTSAVVVVPATEKLSKSELAKAVMAGVPGAAGEIPDGARMTEEEDRFFVK